MRKMLFAAAAVIGLIAVDANAQTYRSGAAGDTSPEQYLQAAQDALARRQNFAARESLERAETRLLDRSVSPSMANQPNTSPLVMQIAEARRAIDRGDYASARQLISQAMSNASASGSAGPGGMGSSGMGAERMSPGNMGSGSLGAGGGMGPGSMGSREMPMQGSDVPGQASPMNDGTGLDQLPARR